MYSYLEFPSLLKFSKKQILDYTEKMNLVYVNDPSNKDKKYSRVVVRNFIKKNFHYKKNIIQEFELIRKNFYDYKKMIFQIYNLINFEIHKDMIMFDSVKFLNLDQEIQAKFIEITYKFFNPKKDKFIKNKYSINNYKKKKKINKKYLQKEYNLPEKDIPLFGLVTRLVKQKGLDILLPALENILIKQKIQLVVLGTGQEEYEEAFIKLTNNKS